MRREEKKKARQAEAEVRQLFRGNLSPEQQLDALDKRLGYGQGASKERTRLAGQIEQRDNPPVVEESAADTAPTKRPKRQRRQRKEKK